MDNINFERIKKINNLKNALVFKGIILILFILTYFFYISGEIDEYEVNKSNLLNIYNEYSDYKHNGYGLEGYKKAIKDKGGLSELVLKVEDVDEKFFNDNFENTGTGDYLNYLNGLSEKIKDYMNSEEYIEKNKKVSKILPTYDKNGNIVTQSGVNIENQITDLGYINTIERILKTFNLSYDSGIGINSIIQVNDELSKNDKLSTSLYMIPLSLELTGRKVDILKFLYFVSKSGVVKSVTNDGLEFYKESDGGILSGIKIQGDSLTPDYNIYETMLFDISSFSVNKYIDKSINIRKDDQKSVESLIEFINGSEEKNEEYKIEITLNTYVKGLPLFKYTEIINGFIKDYNQAKSDLIQIEKYIKDNNKLIINSNKSIIISKYKIINNFFNDTKAAFDTISKSLNNTNNIELIYNNSQEINSTLQRMKVLIEDINAVRNSIK